MKLFARFYVTKVDLPTGKLALLDSHQRIS